ncbi:MAG: protein arginine kinase [Clostridia bacterium]|nr:protein arginine kinase [Clostridia bacterium]
MTTKWYQQSGTDGDVVVSTRIRLARNLNHMPFPSSMTAEQREEIIRPIFEAFPQDGTGAFQCMRMTDLSPLEALSMVERHLISPAFASQDEGTALLLSPDESVSVMINEEDHIRIQAMCAGLALDEAFRAANCWDDFLDSRLHFAFDDRLGYLTQCPTNLGTGMRASVMLHLPALQEKGVIQQLANTVSKLGLTIRGMYGEGSRPEGAMYQLSNQVTLGITEQEAIENLKSIVAQIIKEERQYREQLRQSPSLEDRVYRSLGVLQNARLLTGKEFMTLISHVRMGVSMNVLDTVDLNCISSLMVDAQPAALMRQAGEKLEPAERDARRAALVRDRLTKGA